MSALDRHYWRNRARDVLPSASAREIVRAAHLLAWQYDASTVRADAYGVTLPAYVTNRLDPRAFDGVRGGGVPDMTPAPEPFKARQHEMRGDGTVARRGRARVQGGTVGTSRETPSGFSGGLLSQMLEDLDVTERSSVGVLAWPVERLTRLFYGPGIPDLLGSDVQAFKQDHIAGIRLDRSSSAIRGVHVDPDEVCTSQTTRYALPAVYARKGEHVTSSQLLAPGPDAEHVWVGHTLRPRAPLAASTQSKARQVSKARNEARTVGVVTTDAVPDVFNAVSTLNRGERVVITFRGTALTVTRGKSTAGTFAIRATGHKARGGIRTPETVARHAVDLVA